VSAHFDVGATHMTSSIETQYDEVTKYIRSYLKFSRTSLFEGISYILSRHFPKMFKLIILSSKWNKNRNPLSIRNAPKEYQEFVKELLPTRIIENPFYSIWGSQWPLEALRIELTKKFPQVDFSKLSEIHFLRESKTQSEQLPVKKILGMIFAVCTIVLQIVPKELIERMGLFNYGSFKIATFFVTIGLVLYILLIFLPFWIKSNKIEKEYREVGFILKYAEISLRETKSNKTNTADS